MKANNGTGDNHLRDGWRTPSELFNPLYNQYKFGFDCCADVKNKLCDKFSDNFENINTIEEVAWMNPPFSIAWKMFDHFFKVVKKGVAIYRCDNMESGIWQKLIFKKCSWIFIPNRRVCYEGIDGEGPRFPTAIIGVGIDVPDRISGTILEVKLKTELNLDDVW